MIKLKRRVDKLRTNIIEFYPSFKDAEDFFEPPLPAVHANIPEWLRKTPKYRHGDTSFIVQNGENNLSVRHCIPMLEGFTSGYVVVLNRDIQVRILPNKRYSVTWTNGGSNLPDCVTPRQENEMRPESSSFPVVEGYERAEFNWMPYWNIKTPRGYSCIFTHPINRIDLPFYTLGAVVDTDGWGEAGNHPFLIKKGWEGIIPQGTPLFQIIPFKRDNWKSSIRLDLVREYIKKVAARDRLVRGWYKKHAWATKSYK
jgi:hypothetical protein